MPYLPFFFAGKTLFGSFPAPGMPEQNSTVKNSVHEDHEKAQDDLCIPGKGIRIYQRGDIMVDKTAGIALFPCKASKSVLQGCQRTDPSHEFDERPPGRRRKMHQTHPRPPPGKEPTPHDKKNEDQVEDNDEIRRHAMDHCASLGFRGREIPFPERCVLRSSFFISPIIFFSGRRPRVFPRATRKKGVS